MKNLRIIDVFILILFIPVYLYNPYIHTALTKIFFRHEAYHQYQYHSPTNNANGDNFYYLLKTATSIFNINIKGIIHIGANIGQEQPIYNNFEIKNILWIEADPSLAEKLKNSVKANNNQDIKVANFAASNVNNSGVFFKTNNNGLSSSLLKLKKHKIIFPDIIETAELPITLKTLDKYFIEQQDPSNKQKYNFLVLDIQGAELLALEGAKNTLKQIDGIISEINYDELYEKGTSLEELDKFLIQHQFIRVDTKTESKGYGNALYINKMFLNI